MERSTSGSTPEIRCSGNSLFEQLNVALNGNTAGSKASTSNDGTPTAGTKDGYTITGTGGTFSWKVTYEGDTNTDGVNILTPRAA